MKYRVGVVNTRCYEYNVEATSEKEAKALANELHNNPKTQDIAISDWDYDVEEDDSGWEDCYDQSRNPRLRN